MPHIAQRAANCRRLSATRPYAGPATGVVVAAFVALGLAVAPAAAQQDELDRGDSRRTQSLLNQLTQDEDFGPPPAPEAEPPQPVVRPEAGPVRVAQADTLSRRAARDTGDDLDLVIERGSLRVGTTLFAPYAMRDAAGTLIGHEIDIALAIGADLGVEVEIVPLTDEELVAALERGSIDVIIGAYAVTPTRARQVTFTRPYARRRVHLIAARRGAPRGDALDAFNRDDVRIGVARGTTGERVALEALGKAALVRFSDPQAAKTALLEDQIKVLIAASPFPEVLVAQSGDRFTLPLTEPLSETALAFAIRGGNPDMLAFLDAWIVARSLDRFLEKTEAYWFNSTDWLPRLTEAPKIDRIDATVR